MDILRGDWIAGMEATEAGDEYIYESGEAQSGDTETSGCGRAVGSGDENEEVGDAVVSAWERQRARVGGEGGRYAGNTATEAGRTCPLLPLRLLLRLLLLLVLLLFELWREV